LLPKAMNLSHDLHFKFYISIKNETSERPRGSRPYYPLPGKDPKRAKIARLAILWGIFSLFAALWRLSVDVQPMI